MAESQPTTALAPLMTDILQEIKTATAKCLGTLKNLALASKKFHGIHNPLIWKLIFMLC